jgi:hypothetical protein
MAATASRPKFCSECGTRLREDARFCHECGATLDGQRRATAAPDAAPAAIPPTFAPPPGDESRPSAMLRWGMPAFAIVALILLSVWSAGSRNSGNAQQPGLPLGSAAPGGAAAPGVAPDISSMSPEERADRLFNRVMRLSSEGKRDSAAFFASMAYGALESLQPLDAHKRYDLGLIALVAGDAARAHAQADTILAARSTHLLGLSLAARAAEARGDMTRARALHRRLLAAEAAEKAAGLPEYTDHEADVRTAVEAARKG